jgi:hypothetical protein
MTDAELVFLKTCHATLKGEYDNSITLPPSLAAQFPADGDKLWLDYLKCKFYVMSFLQADRSTPAENLRVSLAGHGFSSLTCFVEDWAGAYEAERTAFRLRVSQLPQTAVYDRWYCGARVQSCEEWCRAEYRDYLSYQEELTRGDWPKLLESLCARISTLPIAGHDDDIQAAAILRAASIGMDRRLDAVTTYLNGSPAGIAGLASDAQKIDVLLGNFGKCLECSKLAFTASTTDPTPGRVDHPLFGAILRRDLLVDLHIKLMTEFYGKGRDLTTVIRTFLDELKHLFNCEVCDYLKVESIDPRLRWSVATFNLGDFPRAPELSEQEFQSKLEREESYLRGEGITGSIFLQDPSPDVHVWQHIGSNDVQNDPRAAREKQEHYEQQFYHLVLKDQIIHNFWTFPLFIENQLFGAFRVVNRFADDGSLKPGGWSYMTRVQLALVAVWFSRFLQAILPHTLRTSEYRDIAERQAKVAALVSSLELGWLDIGVLQTFLGFLARTLNRRVEKRVSGCTIILVKRVAVREFVATLPKYPLLHLMEGTIPGPYDKLDVFLDVVDPLQGAFVFDEKGEFIRLVRLRLSTPSSMEGMAALLECTRRSGALALVLTRDVRRVRVIHSGEPVLELQVSERTGEWQWRDRLDFGRQLGLVARGVPEDVLRIVCSTCFLMSERRWGGMFVIGEPARQDRFNFDSSEEFVGKLRLGELSK